jgi:hypothetical protein
VIRATIREGAPSDSHFGVVGNGAWCVVRDADGSFGQVWWLAGRKQFFSPLKRLEKPEFLPKRLEMAAPVRDEASALQGPGAASVVPGTPRDPKKKPEILNPKSETSSNRDRRGNEENGGRGLSANFANSANSRVENFRCGRRGFLQMGQTRRIITRQDHGAIPFNR